jgi:hypothetical protein
MFAALGNLDDDIRAGNNRDIEVADRYLENVQRLKYF